MCRRSYESIAQGVPIFTSELLANSIIKDQTRTSLYFNRDNSNILNI